MRGFHRSSVRALPLVLSLALLVTTGLLVVVATDLGAAPAITPGTALSPAAAAALGGSLANKPCDERLGLPACDPVTCNSTCNSAGYGDGACLLNCCVCLGIVGQSTN